MEMAWWHIVSTLYGTLSDYVPVLRLVLERRQDICPDMASDNRYLHRLYPPRIRCTETLRRACQKVAVEEKLIINTMPDDIQMGQVE